MKIRICYNSALLLVAILLIAVPGYGFGTPKQVTRILYGPHAEQIGVSWAGGHGDGDNPYDLGPRGFAVDDRGDFYLGDYVSGAIKRFSPKGQLLAVTEGLIINLQSFWVSPTGDIYARNEDRSSEVIRFDARGHRVWARTFREIVPQDELAHLEQQYGEKFPMGFSTEITAGPHGTIMIKTFGQLPTGRAGQEIGILISDAGQFIETRPYFGLKSGEIWWQYNIDEAGFTDGVAPPVTVKLYTEDGTVKQTISLDVRADTTRYQHMTKYSSVLLIPDQRNGTFLITLAPRKDPLKVTPTTLVKFDYVVDRYNADGKFVERFSFPDGPFVATFRSNIAIGQDGKFYYMRYDSKGFDAMVCQ